MSTPFFHRFAPVRALAFALPLLLVACGGGAGPEMPGPVDDPLAAAAATITAEDMLGRIGVLAHDSMRGRDTPSPELDRAARYIMNEFRRMGLEGGAGDGEFIQLYPFPLIGIDAASADLAFAGAEGVPSLTYGEDYLVLPGATEAARGAPVFVGTAVDFGASTPASGSLAGRVPIAFLPGGYDGEVRGAMNRAQAAAVAAGAQAIVFVLDPLFVAEPYGRLRGYLGVPRRMTGGPTGIPVVLLRHEPALAIFRAAGSALLEDAANVTAPAPIGSLSVDLAAPVDVVSDDDAPNVIAILPGSDPELRDEYVVFSAHMDHVGVGRPDESGDSIYNGADDNASGTSGLIEVAEAFSNLLQRPRRSLMFMAVSGEEKGLLGSHWFSEHPTVPIEDIVANINVDMIGRNAPDTIVVIGQEYSSLGPLVRQVAQANPGLGLIVSEDIWPEERFFFRSDHFNFARKDIPALFFFAGVHDDYHRPSDEPHLIDGDKASRVARLVFYTAHAIADATTAPQWTEEGLAAMRALISGGR